MVKMNVYLYVISIMVVTVSAQGGGNHNCSLKSNGDEAKPSAHIEGTLDATMHILARQGKFL